MTTKKHLVVGIGASAGGLEAFTGFFSHMPPDSGMAFVLIQHLAADRVSLLTELLQRHTEMMVIAAEEGMTVEPNRVFVIPPDATLTIKKGRLHLKKPAPTRKDRWPVDSFLTSLANDQGECAVCIILSGGGSDGTIGLKAVKEHGGFTLAQSQHDADAMPGMPRSANATGLVDFVLPVEDMPAKLVQYQQYLGDVEGRKASDGTREDIARYVAQICALVKNHTGHDFSQYKTKTLIRRIQRRMQIVHADAGPDYVRLLRRDAQECRLLFLDLLINVTQFFRDGVSFDTLETAVIPKLLDTSEPDAAIRVWVPGCATGEEAYSIAILLKEAMSNRETIRKVQIFGTDLDEDAVRLARAARFPSSIASHMTRERFERWFVQEGDDYCPLKSIREMCIFSVHDTLKDPPFSKLDLLSCRNLFIYLNAAAQFRLLELFHYALREDGYLFLGSSEGVSQQFRMFKIVNKQHRIFQRKNVLSSLPRLPVPERARSPLATARTAETQSQETFDRNWRQVLTQIAPPCVVVNQSDEIVRYFGLTGRYLEPSPGAASLNLFSVLRSELRAPVRALLQQARELGKIRSQPHVVIPVNGSRQALTLIVAPLGGESPSDSAAIVAFSEEGPPVPNDGKGEAQVKSDAEQEVRALRDQLSAAGADLEAANEELKSASEEYQSVNEELQSTNEELETAKEELQSINEELQTVNAELSVKNEDLGRANSDMRNFLDSTDIASLFLDNDLRIKTYTPALRDLINIRESDRGRPISDLTGQLIYSDIESDVRKVLRTLSSIEREVSTNDHTIFMMRIRPYRSIDNVIDGVVIIFVDVTGRRRSGAGSEQLGAIIEDAWNEVYVMDGQNLRFTNVNHGARKNLGYTMDELRTLGLADLEPDASQGIYQAEIAGLRAGKVERVSFTTNHRRKDGSQYPVQVHLIEVSDPPLLVANVLAVTTRDFD